VNCSPVFAGEHEIVQAAWKIAGLLAPPVRRQCANRCGRKIDTAPRARRLGRANLASLAVECASNDEMVVAHVAPAQTENLALSHPSGKRGLIDDDGSVWRYSLEMGSRTITARLPILTRMLRSMKDEAA